MFLWTNGILYRTISHYEKYSKTLVTRGPAKKLSEKIRKSEALISKLKTHSEKGTCPQTLRYNARANITTEIKLNRIKQLQSRKSFDAKQSRDKAHSAVSDPNTISHAEKIETIQKRMDELEKMMLDLQKNENRGSESYPIVSFMSTVNFEREKTLTKSAICTIKHHGRRKSLGAIRKKQEDANKRYIKNLSNLELTQAQIYLLSRGLKFIPIPLTSESHIRTQLLNDFKTFSKRMRLQYIFYG